MNAFDITTLLEFFPPTRLCVKCRALNQPVHDSRSKQVKCRACGLDYTPTANCNHWQYQTFLEENRARIKWANPVAHARSLAGIALQHRKRANETDHLRESPFTRSMPPLRVLFLALLEAKHFVHIISYGISHQLIGVLRLISQRTAVRIVLSNADASAAAELTEFHTETPFLEARLFDEGLRRNALQDVPHQKLIVIDGLMAFKGSANLTLSGWRKSDKGLEVVEAVTDVSAVAELHNKHFARIWGDTSNLGASIPMEVVPF